MLLGFKKRFRAPIESGAKIHTMRDVRKNPPKIGERLFMYTGLRTKYCELITNRETLRATQQIEIKVHVFSKIVCAWIDGRCLDVFEVAEFVQNDGFDDAEDFAEWWIAKIPKQSRKPNTIITWEGCLHHWTDKLY